MNLLNLSREEDYSILGIPLNAEQYSAVNAHAQRMGLISWNSLKDSEKKDLINRIVSDMKTEEV